MKSERDIKGAFIEYVPTLFMFLFVLSIPLVFSLGFSFSGNDDGKVPMLSKHTTIEVIFLNQKNK